MRNCPICAASGSEYICPNCGFDFTRDFLRNYSLAEPNSEDIDAVEPVEKKLQLAIAQIKKYRTKLSTLKLRPAAKLKAEAVCDELIYILSSETNRAEQDAPPKNSEELFERALSAINNENSRQGRGAAAAQCQADAMLELGIRAYEGTNGHKDPERAFSYFKKAAEEGSCEAMKRLGYMYENGIAVPQSDAYAFEWYSSAAKQKDAEALCSLAHMYRDGRGCIKDSAKAFKCYSDSARYGDVPAAMTNLARCYEKGIGVTPDAAMAGYWREEALRAAYANDKR